MIQPPTPYRSTQEVFSFSFPKLPRTADSLPSMFHCSLKMIPSVSHLAHPHHSSCICFASFQLFLITKKMQVYCMLVTYSHVLLFRCAFYLPRMLFRQHVVLTDATVGLMLPGILVSLNPKVFFFALLCL